MSDDNSTLSGGCLCGVIRYELSAPVDKIIQCHCADCQKGSGAGMSPNTPVPTESLRILQGIPKSYSKVVDSGRTLQRFFCGDCGSPLFSRRNATPAMTILRMGSLDEAPSAKVIMNIWTNSARPWSVWDETLPSHPENRPA